jgi:glycosyltransferase involved in cell wall biosynthesis
MRVFAVVPAFQAARTIGALVDDLRTRWCADGEIVVVDDGSTDETAKVAHAAGAIVVRHAHNRGKGTALRTGMARARHQGATHAVTLDADGQHPAAEAVRLAALPAPDEALVLGVRDLVAAGAPRANQRSNAISNYWLSRFAGRDLRDTQCGLRRYPILTTLVLGGQAMGFGYEAEVVLRAALAGLPIVQEPVRVIYPVDAGHGSHFHVVRDPARIIARILATVSTAPRHR